MATYSTLATPADLKRRFYLLTGLSGSDASLDEHSDNEGDTVQELIQQAIWDAQAIYIDFVDTDRWITTSSTLSFSGSDSVDGGRYTALPTDFLRLYGDQEESALRRPDGTRWGRLIETRFRDKRLTRGYYLKNERLWLTRGAQPPSDLVMDYYARHATLDTDDDADADTLDFPDHDRELIPTLAAREAADYGHLFPLPDSQVAILDARIRRLKARIAARGRRSREARKIRRPANWSSRWMVPTR